MENTKTLFPLDHADYHLHTWYSDGRLSPAEMIRRGHARGLLYMAVTDHDTVEGVAEARETGAALGVTVRSGVELSTIFHGRELHILGYDLDSENPELTALLARDNAARNARNDRLIRALNDAGYPVSREELLIHPESSYIGKPGIARLLVKKGFAENKDQVFRDIFPKFDEIKKERASSPEGIHAILAAGGIPVWAHPGKTRTGAERDSAEYYRFLESALDELMADGLQGLECCHPDHSEQERLRFLGWAEERGLYITKGSDDHGD